MLTHPNPEKSFDQGRRWGAAREVLKYEEVEEVQLVEIDEEVVKAVREFSSATDVFDDPRFRLIVMTE